MATVAVGQTASVYVPLASSITFTPGAGGKMSVNGRNADGSAVAPREIYSATTIDAQAGAWLSIEASGADGVYTDPALSAAQVAALGVPGLVAGEVSAATANTAALRASPGRVMGHSGPIYINDTVWLDDGDSLVTDPGCWLQLAPGANKLMVGTAPMQSTPEPITITWAAGNEASVAWTAHGMSVGWAFVVQGANEVQWNDVYRVIAVTDANTVTIALAEFRSAGPTGATTARRCIRLGRVDVELDYDKTNNLSAPQSVDRHASVFAFLQDSNDISVRARNVYKYAANLAGAINSSVRCHGRNVAEILKKYGPMRNCKTYPSGHSVDDCSSFQAKEPAAFIAYMPCFGPIKDHHEYPGEMVNSGGTASGGIVVYADNDHELDGIVIDGGAALSSLNEGVSIKSGDTFTPASAKIGKVTLRDIAIGWKATSDSGLVTECYVDTLTIDRPRFIPPDLTTAALRTQSTARVRVLRVIGWHFNEPEWPSAGASAYLVILNGVHDAVIFEGCSFRGRSGQARLINIGTAGVQSVVLRDCEIESVGQIGILNDGGSVVPRIVMDNVRCSNVASGWDIRDDAIVVMRNSSFSTMTSGVIRPTTNARNVQVYDEGGNTYSSASPITCVAPGQAVPYGYLPIDIGATGITKAAGASAFNTGVGRGTVPQNRPVVCDGTSWFNATNLSHTF